nr:HAD family hydrolase [Streptomyces atriruber]
MRSPVGLRELITSAQYVLFDFDGPICRLFAGKPDAVVAREQVAWLDANGLGDVLTSAEREDDNPHGALLALGRERIDAELTTELEEKLTREELQAVQSAWPTEYADPMIRVWHARGVHLAVTTNNSAEAARRYLHGRGLEDCFGPHIYGRSQNLQLLKPDPYVLQRALSAMGGTPAAALVIGDSPADLDAAQQAGVPFLGYARNQRKEAQLREAGADNVIGSLEVVLELLRAH